MPAKHLFQILPLSIEKGFVVQCEGIIAEPLRVQRLIEAVIAAAQIGQGLDAEVQIFNTAGELVEGLQLSTTATTQLFAHA